MVGRTNFEFGNLIVLNTVKSDLEFDNQIKKDKKYLEFHLYLSKLKCDKFFSSHFIYHSDDMSISKIPTHYSSNMSKVISCMIKSNHKIILYYYY